MEFSFCCDCNGQQPCQFAIFLSFWRICHNLSNSIMKDFIFNFNFQLLVFLCLCIFVCSWVRKGCSDLWENGMEQRNELMLACVLSGTLFSLLGSASFAILWAVNWRPWRIYRWFFLFEFAILLMEFFYFIKCLLAFSLSVICFPPSYFVSQ